MAKPSPMECYADIPFNYQVPSQTLGASGISGNFGMNVWANFTAKVTGGTATLTLYDGNGGQRPITINPGPAVILKKTRIRSWTLTGNGVTVVAEFNWPEEVDPNTLQLNEPVNIVGSVKTDLGQGTGVRDLNNLAQAGQLPATLDGGFLEVSVKKPLTGAGSVQVHDTGS